MTGRVGQQLGNYRLLRKIGQGAFAEVYLGEHLYLERLAAIKVLHVQMETETHEQFRREARTIANLQHPHIVQVHDFGLDDQTPYLVMEYTSGGTLREQHPKGTQLSFEQIVTYVKQIASALDYAHKLRVIHRDVKPANLLLNARGEVVLSDFGLAVIHRTRESLSPHGPAGTPLYMAPEQMNGKPCPASDQYALAIMVYQWLCGEPPFSGPLYAVYAQHLSASPPSLCERLSDLPIAVEEAVFKALAKDPTQRFACVADFASALEHACSATEPLTLQELPQPQTDGSFSTEPEPLTLPRAGRGQEAGALLVPGLLLHPQSGSKGVKPSLAQSNRQRFLRRVRAFWIEGVLDHSLHGAALIALGLQDQRDALANPWHLVFQHSDTAPRSFPVGTSIIQVYDAANGELLLLGAPGAGKTTLLLELARNLLDRAQQDEQQPMPVVFTLSSWATKQQPLGEWMIEELRNKYDIPPQLAHTWIETDQILPLLDGLDEVEATSRMRCIEAINIYHQEHTFLPLVVSSRSADYLAQTARVKLTSAVMIQPLTQQQVDEYLAQAGESLWALRVALHQDAALRELAETPLMLSILTLTYHDMPVEELLRGGLAPTLPQVFERYTERMLACRGSKARYQPEQTTNWLTWLAQQMKQHNQTAFYIEHLQPTWLMGERMRLAYNRWAIRFPAILIGVLVGFLVSLFLSDHNPYSLSLLFPYGLVGGFIGALLSGGKAARFSSQQTTETWRNIWGRLKGSLRDGIFLGCGMGLVIGTSSVFDNYKDYVGPIPRPIFGIIFGVCGFLLSMILRRRQPMPPGSETPARSWRNKWHRMLQTGYLKNGLLIGGYFVVAATLSYGLVETLGEILSPDGLNIALAVGPSDGLSFGLKFGLGAGLIGGLLSVILARWNGIIQPAEVIRWSWGSLWHNISNMKHLRNSLLLGGFFGLTIGMISGFSTGVSSGLSSVLNNGVRAIFEPDYLGLILSNMGMSVVSNGLGLGLSIALSYWFLLGLLQGVSSDTLDEEHRLIPNQGIRDSASNSLRIGIVGALVTCFAYLLSNFLSLFFGLVVNGVFSQHPTSINRPTTTPPLFYILYSFLLYFQHSLLSDFLFAGLVGGLIAGLLMGGLACMRHYVLRFLLWRADVIPSNYARFLDDAAERILLGKVGGGYIFIHRLLLDYFASCETPSPEGAPAVSAIDDFPPAISDAPQADTGHREEKVFPTAPSRKTGFNKENLIATLFVVVLLLASGVSIFSLVQHAVQKANNATATAQAAQIEANTTAEALANASPITYPPQNKFPVLNDPLQDNSKGNNWQEATIDWPDCKFINRAYDINTNGLEWCAANTTDFTNFIYEVQMKIVKGDEGGIVFRVDPTRENHYSFVINHDGSYSVDAYTNPDDTVLAQGSSPAIHQGLNQPNLVAAAVHGNIIELYVNHQRVAVVGSSTYTHGQIGVIVTGSSNNQTEVIFQNAKVWKI